MINFEPWQIVCIAFVIGLGLYFTFIKPKLKKDVQEFSFHIHNYNDYNYELIVDIIKYFKLGFNNHAILVNPLYLEGISELKYTIPFNTELVIQGANENFEAVVIIHVDAIYDIHLTYSCPYFSKKFNKFVQNDLKILTEIIKDKYKILQKKEKENENKLSPGN